MMRSFEIFCRLIRTGSDVIDLKRFKDNHDSFSDFPSSHLHFKFEYPTFQDELFESLNNTKYEIDESLQKVIVQFEKLRFIRNFIDQVLSLSKVIQENNDGLLIHINFHPSSGIGETDVTYTEKDFQDYYHLMRGCCEQLLNYLTGLQDDIKAITPAGFKKFSQISSEKVVINPIIFFDDLIVNGGLQKIWKEFQPSKDETNHYYNVEIDLTSFSKKLWFQNNMTGELEFEEQFFEKDCLIPLMNEQIFTARKKIDQYFLNNSKEKQQNYIDILLRQLIFLNERASENRFPSRFPSCAKIINTLFNYCNKTYGDIQANSVSAPRPGKLVRNKKNKEVQLSEEPKKLSFGFRDTTNKDLILNQIFSLNSIINEGFINQEICNRKDFIQLLTSKNISDEKIEIHFTCETAQLAFIFNKMKKYFKKFNPTSIEATKCFYNKLAKPINKGDLYSANNRSPVPKQHTEITKVFEAIDLGLSKF